MSDARTMDESEHPVNTKVGQLLFDAMRQLEKEGM